MCSDVSATSKDYRCLIVSVSDKFLCWELLKKAQVNNASFSIVMIMRQKFAKNVRIAQGFHWHFSKHVDLDNFVL